MIVINKNHRTLYILGFKQSSNRFKDFIGVKDDDALIVNCFYYLKQ